MPPTLRPSPSSISMTLRRQYVFPAPGRPAIPILTDSPMPLTRRHKYALLYKNTLRIGRLPHRSRLCPGRARGSPPPRPSPPCLAAGPSARHRHISNLRTMWTDELVGRPILRELRGSVVLTFERGHD